MHLVPPEALLHWLSVAMLVTALLTFVATSFIAAPYGRYSTSRGWGALLPAGAAWAVMESPNLWVPLLVHRLYGSRVLGHLPNMLLLSMFYVHYVNRAVLYPLRVSRGNPMPLSVCALASGFCCWNALIQSLHLIVVKEYPSAWLFDLRFAVGVGAFLIGMGVNVHADNTLLRMRANRKGYFIPTGGLFDYVSCANYSGEVLEWTGFALATWSLPALAFAVYTFANLAPRARRHHQWYLEKFVEYPKQRKAVIPFLW